MKGQTKRNRKLTVNLTDNEMDILNECAERKATTRTDVIVEGVKLVKRELDVKK